MRLQALRRTEDIWRCSYNQCANAITVCFCYKSTVSYSSDGDVIVKCFVVRIANKETLRSYLTEDK